LSNEEKAKRKAKKEKKEPTAAERGPGDWAWPKSVGLSSLTEYFWPTREQVAAWYTNVYEGHTDSAAGGREGDVVGAYALAHGISVEVAWVRIGQLFLRAGVDALKGAARQGVLPPRWVLDVVQAPGLNLYEKVRKQSGSWAGDPESPESLIHWLGGKSVLAASLLPLFPPHLTYVEPFGGGANVLLRKKAVQVEVYNEVNTGLVNLMRVVKDDSRYPDFYEQVFLTHYARSIYDDVLPYEIPDFEKLPGAVRERFDKLPAHEQAQIRAYREIRDGPEGQDNVARAHRWFVLTRANIGGFFGSA
jgi:hypothetical protein